MRRDAVHPVLLRAGHTLLLKAYANQLDRGAANRRTLAAALSQRCSTETVTLWRTIPTALGSYRQPGQRASAC